MICRLFVIASLALAGVSSGQDAQPSTQPSAEPTTQPARDIYADASYGIGFDLGKKAGEAGIKINPEKILEGIKDGMAGKPSAVSLQDIQAALMRLQTEAEASAQAKMKEEGEKNGKAGDAFRADNGKKAGVVTTASGLQIETIKEGTGAQPQPTDKVKVHYTGTLIDGKKFDSSVDRGEPVEFPLNRVIKGWSEGVGAMKVGGKSRLVIPPELAYGPEGAGGDIPPNSTLVFDVELLAIVKDAPSTAPTAPGAATEPGAAADPAMQK